MYRKNQYCSRVLTRLLASCSQLRAGSRERWAHKAPLNTVLACFNSVKHCFSILQQRLMCWFRLDIIFDKKKKLIAKKLTLMFKFWETLFLKVPNHTPDNFRTKRTDSLIGMYKKARNHPSRHINNGFGVKQPLVLMVYDGCPPLVQWWNGYIPSLKSIRAFGENRPDNARIFVILPGFLWFSADSERYWAVCKTAK